MTPERFRAWADELTREASDDAERDSAEREREFAELYAIHDSVLFEAGATDGGSAVLELTRLLGERPALAASISERYPHLIVDELEDACEAERALIGRIAKGSRTTVLSCDDEQGRARCSSGSAAWARSALGQPAEVNLDDVLALRRHRARRRARGARADRGARQARAGARRAAGPETEVAFWSAANERRRGAGRRARDRVGSGSRRGAIGPGLRRGPARRGALARGCGGARGAPRPLSPELGWRLLPAARGPRRDRVAAPARRSDRRGRRGARALAARRSSCARWTSHVARRSPGGGSST